MRIDTEHRAMVLGIIDAEGSINGRQISKTIERTFDKNIIGSIYHLLHRLEDNGFLESDQEGFHKTAPRLYYLTEKGRQELNRCRVHYCAVSMLLGIQVSRASRQRIILSA